MDSIDRIGEDVPLLEGIRTTRAIRRLKPDPVPPALIRKVCEAGTFAPSGGNRQPWFFIAVTEPERRAWVAERYRAHLPRLHPAGDRGREGSRLPGGEAAQHARRDPSRRASARGAGAALRCRLDAPRRAAAAGALSRHPEHPARLPRRRARRSLTTVHTAFGREVDAWLGLPENCPTCAHAADRLAARRLLAAAAAIGGRLSVLGALSRRDAETTPEHIVGVISDTHGLVRPQALAALHGSEHIVHAGDIGAPAVLEALRRHRAGHGDPRQQRPRRLGAVPARDRRRSRSHGTWLYVLHDVHELDLDPRAAGFAAVIAGHSHKPADRRTQRHPVRQPRQRRPAPLHPAGRGGAAVCAQGRHRGEIVSSA